MTELLSGHRITSYNVCYTKLLRDNIEEIRDGFEFLTFAVFILGETFTFGYDTSDLSLKGIHRISGLLLKDMDGELEKLREKDKR